MAIRLFIWMLLLAPLAWNIWLGVNDQLGPDPGKTLVDSLGLWALRLLLVTLMLSPLREITGRVVFLRMRRLVGLFAWFYASLHFVAAIFYVVGPSLPELLDAFSEKTYIILGMIAWLLMVPLGVTSNRWAQRRLGATWRKLHRAIYLLSVLACMHFIWLVRSDYLEPAVYSIVLLLLLMWRIPLWRRLRNNRSA